MILSAKTNDQNSHLNDSKMWLEICHLKLCCKIVETETTIIMSDLVTAAAKLVFCDHKFDSIVIVSH